jgi:hypothetical protein
MGEAKIGAVNMGADEMGAVEMGAVEMGAVASKMGSVEMGASKTGAVLVGVMGMFTVVEMGVVVAPYVGNSSRGVTWWPGAAMREETKLETFLALSWANPCCSRSCMRRERSLSSMARAKDLEDEDMRKCLATKPDTLRAFLTASCCWTRSKILD